MVTWVTSTFRETELTTSREALRLFGSTRNEMQKMQWIPWIILSLTAGKFEFRWRSMAVQLIRIVLVQADDRTTAPTIERDRREEEDPTPQDVAQGREAGRQGDATAVPDQGHHLEGEVIVPDPVHQRDVFQDHAQEVVTEGNQDHQLLEDQIDQDLALLQGKDPSLAQLLQGALPPPSDLDPLEDLVLLLPADHQQEKHPGHPDKIEKIRMILIIRMTIELVHVMLVRTNNCDVMFLLCVCCLLFVLQGHLVVLPNSRRLL